MRVEFHPSVAFLSPKYISHLHKRKDFVIHPEAVFCRSICTAVNIVMVAYARTRPAVILCTEVCLNIAAMLFHHCLCAYSFT